MQYRTAVGSAVLPVLADGQFALRSCVSFLRYPDYALRRYSVYFQFPNDSAVLNPTPVGASIARPVLDARSIRVETVRVVFAVSRLCPAVVAGKLSLSE